MLDSITVANLPPGADAYGAYVDGNWPTYPAVKTRFPGVPVLSIAVSPAADAECCDCESGDLTPGQVPAWVRRQLTRGVTRPVVYCSASIAGAVLRDLATAGVKREQVRLWSAHYAGKHICGPGVCSYPQADGTQWRDSAPGANGSLVDESLLADSFFGPRAARLEDAMLLNKGAGARTPMALPDGCTHVRFFASQTACIEVDLRAKGQRHEKLSLDYTSSHTLRVPSGIHAIVVHRVDDSEHDVSAVACA